MRHLFITISFLALISPLLSAQPKEIKVIDPPFWWTSMPVNELQLQLYGEELGQYTASTTYAGVTITKQEQVDSPNYLFIYFEISPSAKAGLIPIKLKRGKKDATFRLHSGFGNDSHLVYTYVRKRYASRIWSLSRLCRNRFV